MISPQHIHNLRSPFVLIIDIDNPTLSILQAFVVIDDKGGEIVYKDSEKKRWKDKGEIKYDKGRGSIKILSIQVGGASS